MVFIPNGISLFYLVLGVLQLAAALHMRFRCNHDIESGL